MMPKTEFERELEKLLNRYSKENGSGTPDFILAEYLNGCLEAYNLAVRTREHWHGRTTHNQITHTPEKE